LASVFALTPVYSRDVPASKAISAFAIRQI